MRGEWKESGSKKIGRVNAFGMRRGSERGSGERGSGERGSKRVGREGVGREDGVNESVREEE